VEAERRVVEHRGEGLGACGKVEATRTCYVDVVGAHGGRPRPELVEERTIRVRADEERSAAKETIVRERGDDRVRPRIHADVAVLDEELRFVRKTSRHEDLRPELVCSPLRDGIPRGPDVIGCLLPAGVVVVAIEELAAGIRTDDDRSGRPDEDTRLLEGLPLQLRIRRLEREGLPREERGVVRDFVNIANKSLFASPDN
jgi:hypothetical protein